MSLRREGPIFVDGRSVEAVDAVAEVLRYLKSDAALKRESAPGHELLRRSANDPSRLWGAGETSTARSGQEGWNWRHSICS